MKSKITILSLVGCAGLLIVMLSGNHSYSDETGAPAQTTGSPSDGQTCAKSNCHTGSPVTATPGIITSNIPASGYIPGSTYTITSTLTQTGISCWGFEISPQSQTGTLLGTPVITNSTETKIVSTKWVTHKLAGITGASPKVFTFNWIAPATGTGTVTFYGAFNYCNGNGGKSGDFIHTSTMTVNEFVSAVADKNNTEKTFAVYPNPLQEGSQFSAYLDEPTDVKLTMTSVNGKISRVLDEVKQISGSYIYNFDRGNLTPGVYMVNLETGKGITSKKVVIL